MTKRDKDQDGNVADLRGWAAKRLEDYELALRHVDDDPKNLDVRDR